MEGSSEELDEFRLVLKFTWGNTQLQFETHTHLHGSVVVPPPSCLHDLGKCTRPTHGATPTLGMRQLNTVQRKGLAVLWMASSTTTQEAAWLQVRLSGIPGRSVS